MMWPERIENTPYEKHNEVRGINMGLFSKPEVVILKDSCDSKEYLAKLEELRSTVPDSSVVAEKIDKEIASTEFNPPRGYAESICRCCSPRKESGI